MKTKSKKSVKTLCQWSRSELLALPLRKWDDTRPTYDSVLILPTGKMHDSGWGLIAVIGVRKEQPVHICSCCSDDISWNYPSTITMRMDCCLKSGALRMRASNADPSDVFKVSASLSSITISIA